MGNAYEASKILLPPGNSEHQLGLAIDITADPFMNANYSIFDNYAVLETETYQWMLDNCADYGFIFRYPEGKEEYYGTDCTAGHFRYVGVEAAKYITENNLCLEEFVLLYDEDIFYAPGIN
ncbi:MAG: D-alanyl-D-alanine carboxypeptidase family protein [Oscillospiraceae bacterium]|nr:D-alanyl-D-alanine carboxypeptidase family protein [Oscillospiraceae bacterium]